MKKLAVVTGASSGIGKAISEKLLTAGYKVYGIHNNSNAKVPAGTVDIKADLTDQKSFGDIFEQIQEEKIDILINNAGTCLEESGLEFTENSYSQLFNLNFKAPILLTQKLKNKLNHGVIINISSVSDRLAGEGYALYCSSKAALNKYFETVALEEKHMKFISILPDYVDTPLLRRLQANKNFDWNIVTKPEEVANFVFGVIENKYRLNSGAKVIIVNEPLKEDLEYNEDLWGYNITSGVLLKLGSK